MKVTVPYQARNIYSLLRLLKPSSHSEEDINRIELVTQIFCWNGSEQLNMIQNLVIERKVIAGNEIDACIFLNLPVLQTEPLAFFEECFLGQFVTPIRFGRFLELSIRSHAGKAEDGAVEYISIAKKKPTGIVGLRLDHLGDSRSAGYGVKEMSRSVWYRGGRRKDGSEDW